MVWSQKREHTNLRGTVDWFRNPSNDSNQQSFIHLRAVQDFSHQQYHFDTTNKDWGIVCSPIQMARNKGIILILSNTWCMGCWWYILPRLDPTIMPFRRWQESPIISGNDLNKRYERTLFSATHCGWGKTLKLYVDTAYRGEDSSIFCHLKCLVKE